MTKEDVKRICFVVVGLSLIVSTIYITCKLLDKSPTDNDIEQEPIKETVTKPKEEIKLSLEELKNYLSFIPKNENIKDDNVYTLKKVNLNNVDKSLLVKTAIGLSHDCLNKELTCPYETGKEIPIKVELYPTYEIKSSTQYIPVSYINSRLSKMYNYELKNLKNATTEKDIFDVNGTKYIYEDGNFIKLTDENTSKLKHISLTERYDINKKNLTIYEYAAFLNFEDNSINDYANKNSKLLENINEFTTYEEKIKMAENYLNENKKEFTLYKHFYKIVDNNYTWYSTEVVSS